LIKIYAWPWYCARDNKTLMVVSVVFRTIGLYVITSTFFKIQKVVTFYALTMLYMFSQTMMLSVKNWKSVTAMKRNQFSELIETEVTTLYMAISRFFFTWASLVDCRVDPTAVATGHRHRSVYLIVISLRHWSDTQTDLWRELLLSVDQLQCFDSLSLLLWCSLYGRHIAANAAPPPKTNDKSKKMSRKPAVH